MKQTILSHALVTINYRMQVLLSSGEFQMFDFNLLQLYKLAYMYMQCHWSVVFRYILKYAYLLAFGGC
jgi:hypothetical protein